uniref:Uncharacterized protein n=1 Tax=Oryza punctata TaxID=4537 RepID=A0A0E0L657_ORYPU
MAGVNNSPKACQQNGLYRCIPSVLGLFSGLICGIFSSSTLYCWKGPKVAQFFKLKAEHFEKQCGSYLSIICNSISTGSKINHIEDRVLRWGCWWLWWQQQWWQRRWRRWQCMTTSTAWCWHCWSRMSFALDRAFARVDGHIRARTRAWLCLPLLASDKLTLEDRTSKTRRRRKGFVTRRSGRTNCRYRTREKGPPSQVFAIMYMAKIVVTEQELLSKLTKIGGCSSLAFTGCCVLPNLPDSPAL